MPKLWAILTDGTVDKQEPDGREVKASMERAVITGNTVEWYETCYCDPPLKHERSTIYDKFFTDMEINQVNKPPSLEGERFWSRLGQLAKEKTPRYSSRAPVVRLWIT